MAAEPLHALARGGLGVRELSMTPSAIPRVKQAIRAVRGCQVREAAFACLRASTAEEVERLLLHELAEVVARPGDDPRPLGAIQAKE
jgi:phosphoenolpyruvate-protein phosphotransferase (PTS system enzyme I)